MCDSRIPHPAHRWLTRSVLGIGLASLFSDLSHEVTTSVLPAFLASMGVAAAALGTIEGMADGLSMVAKLFGGYWADRLHRRKPLCASGYGVMALATLVIAFATVWPIVLAGRTLAWVSRGLRTPARKALLAEAATPETYGRAFGFERAMDTTGAILAPLAVLALLSLGLPHKQVIALSVIPAVLAVLAVVFFVRETPDRVPVRRPFLQSFTGFPRDFKRFLFAVGLFGLGDFADTFYILYAVSVLAPKIGAAQAATASVALYALHNVLYAGWSYFGGWLADRMNKRVLLVAGYACAIAAALIVAFGASNWVALVLLFALGGSAVGLYEAVEDAMAADLLPKDRRGGGYGALAVVTGGGDMVSSLAVGGLWAVFGTAAAFGIAAGVMALGTLLMLASCRHRDAAV